jgi:hypothetical protein
MLPVSYCSTMALTRVVVALSEPQAMRRYGFVVGLDGVTSLAYVHSLTADVVAPVPMTSVIVGGVNNATPPRCAPKRLSASRTGRTSSPTTTRS